MEKVCWSCNSFKAYYTKGYCCFLKEKCGQCRKHDKVVGKHEACENWSARTYNLKAKKSAIIRGLGDALKNIEMIKQILTEDDD